MTDTVRAPELDAGLGWLNTDRPLSLDGEVSWRVPIEAGGQDNSIKLTKATDAGA